MPAPPDPHLDPHLDPTGAPPGPDPVPATPTQLAWLEGQLRRWQADGLLDAAAADAIRARYVAHRRVTLARIVLTLGAVFFGLGMIWTVAGNLDTMSPSVRFTLVSLVWLGFLVVAEMLAARRPREDAAASPVVGALRLLATAAFGAVLFQAAQSLQVPAYEPALLAVWGLGALVHAYVVGAIGPVVVGVGLLAGWVVWHVGERSDAVLDVTVGVAAAAVVAVAVGVLHGLLAGRWPTGVELGVPWREVGAVLVLGVLFAAALPADDRAPTGSLLGWVVGAAALVLAVAAALTGGRVDRLEVLLAVLGSLAAVLLAAWHGPAGTDPAGVTGADWARAVLAVGLYLVVASGYAVLGGMRDSGRLTWIATGALVVFVTTQAFAVFAPILSGAALFLAVGVVLLGTGVVAGQGRRRLVAGGREVLT